MVDVEISSIAALIADPTRSEILLCLMDGRSFPLSDLAAMAHVSLPTASYHMDLLVRAELVAMAKLGRHRYFQISSDRVAELIELLGSFGLTIAREPRLSNAQRPLAAGRVCYNHLAGRAAIQMRLSLERQGFLIQQGQHYAVTDRGAAFFSELGLSENLIRRTVLCQTKACLDWTERIPHIGGHLGRGLFDLFIDRSWIVRGDLPRQIVLTDLGRNRFLETFGHRIQSDPELNLK